MALGVGGPSTTNTPPTGSRPPEREASQRNADGPAARRGIRTVALSAVVLFGLAGLAGGILWSSLGPPERTASGGRPADESAGTGPPGPSGAEGPAIAGTISVAPELRGRVSDGGTLFIIARRSSAGVGPPFAAKRIVAPHFPLEYRLGPGDVMMAGSAFEGDLHVSVRLSKSGVAGPGEPGDLEGEHPGQVPVGARGVDIVIARVR